jgi:8-oxo-dGTP diphosphatase
VGGKIEENESPRESALREIEEETGISLDSIDFKGIVTWIVDGKLTAGCMLISLSYRPISTTRLP